MTQAELTTIRANTMSRQAENIAASFDECRTPAELRRRIDTLCAEFGPVFNVTLLCGGNPAEKKQCVIDLVPGQADIRRCAARLGGSAFGFSSVLIELSLPPEFACPRTPEPETVGCSCTARA